LVRGVRRVRRAGCGVRDAGSAGSGTTRRGSLFCSCPPACGLLLYLTKQAPPPRRAGHGGDAHNIRGGKASVLSEGFGLGGPSRPRRGPRPAGWRGAGLDANHESRRRRFFSSSTSAAPAWRGMAWRGNGELSPEGLTPHSSIEKRSGDTLPEVTLPLEHVPHSEL